MQVFAALEFDAHLGGDLAVAHAPDGSLTLGEWPTAAGDSITVRALRDCAVVVSGWPQDLILLSRGGVTPLALEVEPWKPRARKF
jgi:hypothetical protein